MEEDTKEVIERLSMKAITSKLEAKDYPNCIVFKKDLINILNEIDRLQKENTCLKKEIDEAYNYVIGYENLKEENEELKNKKYMMSISCDGECQICEYYKNEYLIKTENQQLKKGINSLMNSRKKWKDRYYKLKTENSNISNELIARTDELNKLIEENKKMKEKHATTYQLNVGLLREIRVHHVPKSVIRDKIEEFKKEISKLENKGLWNEPFDTIKRNRFVNYINILKELLEGE